MKGAIHEGCCSLPKITLYENYHNKKTALPYANRKGRRKGDKTLEINFDTLRNNIKESIDNISNMFSILIERKNTKDIKRANLMSYWLKTYSHYILSKDTFNPQSLIRYKRGAIIQVEFGYRIGRELGGRHYAVVIDNNNSFNSDTITVVPLSSLKENHTENNKYTYVLQEGLYDLLQKKIDKKREEIKNSLNQIASDISDIRNKYKQGLINFENYKKEISIKRKAVNECELLIDNLDRSMKQMLKLKKGTIVNVGQVITISKMRISNPKSHSDSLYGIKLSKKDLDTLNEKLKKLYIYNDFNA